MAFTHVVTAENRNVFETALDHPAINGRPDQIVFVTQLFGTYNPQEVGIGYDPSRARWIIRNENKMPLATELRFNVLVPPAGLPTVYRHTTTDSNTKEYYTFIDHPASDLNPDALLLVTTNNPAPTDMGPLGVWYDGRRWSIYRQDKQRLSGGLTFNVLVTSVTGANEAATTSPLGLRRAFQHEATAENTRGYLTSTGHNAAGDIVFAMHNWRDSGPYNFHPIGVWHDGAQWLVFNQDRGEIERSAKFNLFVFGASATAVTGTNGTASSTATTSAAGSRPAARPAADQAMGWLELHNAEEEPVRFTFSYSVDGETRLHSSGVLEPGKVFRHAAPARARDFRIRGETVTPPVRMLPNQNFPSTPNLRISSRIIPATTRR